MSTQLVWQLINKHNSFKRKNRTGDRKVLSAEPGNLYNKHSYKYSGTKIVLAITYDHVFLVVAEQTRMFSVADETSCRSGKCKDDRHTARRGGNSPDYNQADEKHEQATHVEEPIYHQKDHQESSLFYRQRG